MSDVAPDAPAEMPGNGNMDRLMLMIYDFLTSKSLLEGAAWWLRVWACLAVWISMNGWGPK